MKRIKTGIKKIILIYKKWAFLHSDSFRKLKRDKSKRKIVLIDTPSHGNLGDQAIVLAEQNYIRDMISPCFYELSQEEYIVGRKALVKVISQGDILMFPGGGFIGTLWQNEEDVVLSILEDFPYNKIVIFPQTVFFEKSKYGEREKERLQKAVLNCSDIKIFLRDKESYRIMLEELHLTSRKCFLVPDIVTYLKVESDSRTRKGILFCMRNDKEKVSDEKTIKRIQDYCTEKGEEFSFTDTVIHQRVGKKKRKRAVEQKFLEFSCAKLIITDRMHGMLFAAITGTPCIAFDNISRKVSGAYEWIRYLDYIRFIEEKELTVDFMDGIFGKEECRYSNIELQDYYNLMKKEIVP